MVRVEDKTHEALREIGARWFSQWVKGSTEGIPPPPDNGQLAINSIILELIRRDDEHRARARKKSPRVPRKGKEPEDGQKTG